MRLLTLVLLTLAGSLAASEPAPWPLWDGQESVADYARRVNLPPSQTLDLGNGVKLELVLIPAGRFVMGTPEPPPVDEAGFQKKILTGQALLAASAVALLALLCVIVIVAIRKHQRPKYSLLWLLAMTVMAGGCVLSGLHWRKSAKSLESARMEYEAAMGRFLWAEDNEKPAHPVTLTNPFYMGKFVVTQEQYKQVIGSIPSQAKGKDNPVEAVSWHDAQAFCKKLSDQTKRTLRLPTEAEWEFACRAGTTTTYYSGDTEADLDRVAWYNSNSKRMPHPVGQKEPNAFGLYDMHGNVWQWCMDYAINDEDFNYYPLRGGSWFSSPRVCRSAGRGINNPVIHDFLIGFRVGLGPARAP